MVAFEVSRQLLAKNKAAIGLIIYLIDEVRLANRRADYNRQTLRCRCCGLLQLVQILPG
jgi:hypothetical protein